MFKTYVLAACALTAIAAPAHATDVALATASGQAGYSAWRPFNVNDLDAASFGVEWIDNADSASAGFGSALFFTFTIAAGATGTLTVVDAGFAGDTFNVTNFGSVFGSTSAVPATVYDSATLSVANFDAALASPSFSRGLYTLAAGTYRIGGVLDQSVTFDGTTPLNATLGAVRLTVATAVPEPSTWALLLAGAAFVGLLARRRL